MKRTALASLAAITGSLSIACGASMVNRPGSPNGSKYAPVNEASRGGVIKYSTAGASFVVEKRRQDAYKQMSEACASKYRIDAEGPRTEGGVVIPLGAPVGGAAMTTSDAWYIQFSCVREPV